MPLTVPDRRSPNLRRVLGRLAARGFVDQGIDRRTSWLELFFDLVFAAAVAEVAGLMGHQLQWSGVLHFLPPFLLIWWAWIGHTFFSTRFDSDDTLGRLLTVGQMFLVAVMAANAHPSLLGREGAGLLAAYSGMRVLLALQYARTIPVDPTGTVARRYAVGIGATALIWLAAGLVPGPARLGLGGAALAIDLACPFWAADRNRYPPHRAHLPERFGLFTLIVLGQLVAETMGGMRRQEVWSPGAAGAAGLGLALAFGLWWLYFVAARVPEPRPRDARGGLASWIWPAAHLPLCFGVVVTGAGIEQVIASGGVAPLPAESAGPLAAGLGLVLAATALIAAERGGQTPGRASWARLGRAVLIVIATLVLASVANGSGSVWLVGSLVAGLIATLAVVGRTSGDPAGG